MKTENASRQLKSLISHHPCRRKIPIMNFFSIYFQVTFPMVALYNCFPRTYYRIGQRHGMFYCHPLHDVDLGLYVHSHLQLENDQGHGLFHVHFLLFICTGLFGIRKQVLRMSVIKGNTYIIQICIFKKRLSGISSKNLKIV